MNVRDFAAKLNALKDEIPKQETAKAAIRLGERAVDSLVARSPVGNPALWASPPPAGYVPGTFKNSWVVSIGAEPSNTRRAPDAGGSGSLADKSKLQELNANPYQIIHIGNDLPYAWHIETGWSKQAPSGVVAVTLQSLKAL